MLGRGSIRREFEENAVVIYVAKCMKLDTTVSKSECGYADKRVHHQDLYKYINTFTHTDRRQVNAPKGICRRGHRITENWVHPICCLNM